MLKTTSVLAALALGLGTSVAALAQSPAGSPADPNTIENQQSGPSVANPTDPAAGDNPAARVPTAPKGEPGMATEGASPGTSGFDAPAGSPADPNSTENRQTGPSLGNPSDPAAGSDPAARMPTDQSAP